MRTYTCNDGRTTLTSPFVDLAEAALYCRCSEDAIMRAVAQRLVTYLQWDDTITFRVADLDRLADALEVPDRDSCADQPDDDAAPGGGSKLGIERADVERWVKDHEVPRLHEYHDDVPPSER